MALRARTRLTTVTPTKTTADGRRAGSARTSRRMSPPFVRAFAERTPAESAWWFPTTTLTLRRIRSRKVLGG